MKQSKKQSKNIYPLAYKLSPKQTCTLYYLGFPASWKKALLDIARKNNPNFNDEYGLPSNTLKKLVNSWMEGIADLSVLSAKSNDEHWLTSYCKYSEKSIEKLCGIIKAWINATYITSPKVKNTAVKDLAREFRNSMRWEDLAATQSSEEVCLTNEDGTVNDYAYQVIPLIAVNRLLSKEIPLNGEILHLCYVAKNRLISNPITDISSHHRYSFVFDFSVQTTPPKRKALLLCQMSIRRWIPDTYNKEKTPYLENAINVHIKIPGEDKYCQVPIESNKYVKHPDWKMQDNECYDIWAKEKLPPAEEVLKNPATYSDKYLLPYKNGMRGFVEPKIGTGVSVLDKANLYNSIFDLLGDMVCEQPIAERAATVKHLKKYKSPQEYESSEDFRNWVSKCAETDKITFELYGLWKDDSQKRLLERIEEKIKLDFGEEKDTSCLKVSLVHKEVGDLANEIPIPAGETMKSAKIKQRYKIVSDLGKTNTVTACIFILPGKDDYGKGDPKSVIRNAFAETGRVIQFVTPSSTSDKKESEKSKIENAVYDIYRQLGIVTLFKINEKQPELVNVPCVGMHILTQIQGRTKGNNKNKARFLPIYVTVNLKEGKTLVQCDAFSKRTVSYRQACLEMANLFWKSDLEELSKKTSEKPAKQKLLDLKNIYDTKDNCVLMLVQSDGNTRALWSGISDKEIGDYSVEDKYCPSKINVGKSTSKYPLTLTNSGVRIIRIRSNQEVPDYYTELSSKATDENLQRSSVQGVFKYEDVYWGIHGRPNEQRYKQSGQKSKIDFPKDSFDEKDMIELYPLQLQSGDNADRWILFAQALSEISIQYNRPTILPLPLHLAKCLEEYLFNP